MKSFARIYHVSLIVLLSVLLPFLTIGRTLSLDNCECGQHHGSTCCYTNETAEDTELPPCCRGNAEEKDHQCNGNCCKTFIEIDGIEAEISVSSTYSSIIPSKHESVFETEIAVEDFLDYSSYSIREYPPGVFRAIDLLISLHQLRIHLS